MYNRDFDFEPDFDPNLGIQFYSIPVDGLSDMVNEYIAKMEIERTNDWCKCEWITHPDDVELDIHNCRTCQHPHLLHNLATAEPYMSEGIRPCSKCPCDNWVDPPKRRMRRGETNMECPVHTKEGFLLGFFKWVFEDDKKD